MPGPCDPEDLLDGIIFGAKYLGSTQLQTDRNPSTNARMAQAQEAVDRIKVKNIICHLNGISSVFVLFYVRFFSFVVHSLIHLPSAFSW